MNILPDVCYIQPSIFTFPSTISEWTSLDRGLKNSESFAVFRTSIFDSFSIP